MERNMGSEHKDMTLKKTLRLKAKKVNTESLVVMGRMLKKTQRLILAAKYGKILDLLEVNVQVEAITAAAQYYDPPLRCLTFQDFQLAPTLEEFEQILGLPLEGKKPYFYIGHYASIQTVASVLKVHARDLQGVQQNRNGTKGFSREYLEGHMRHLAKSEDWDAFMDVLALTIYGLVLFPNIDDYVDYAAIDVFLACKFNTNNPAPALLADVYCTLNFCHEKNGKRILCCLPMLYVWLTTHIFNRSYRTECPIADFNMYQLKNKNSREWADHLAELDEKQIRWYPRWKDIEAIIYQCGGFPNIPLMGTRGCINYNPVLAQRQLGYPMMGPPAEVQVTPFVLYYDDMENIESLQKIRSAWDRIIRRGKELGVRSCAAKESYRQWVRDRVQEIKLPFKAPTIPLVNGFSASAVIENEETKEMKAKITRMEEEREKMEAELRETRHECAALKRENVEKDRILEGANKKMKMEHDYLLKTKHCLGAANKELGLRRQERDRVMAENQQLKEQLKNAKLTQGNAMRLVEEMKQQMKVTSEQYESVIKNKKLHMKETISEYEAALQQEHEKMKELMNQVEQQRGDISGWKEEAYVWRSRFAKLACLANSAIADTPYHLRKADRMINPFETPVEISDFIEYCKGLIGQWA